MRVLGIDPGSITAGFGIIDSEGNRITHVENGGLFAKAKDPLSKRLFAIYTQFKELLSKFRPDEVALEEVFLAQNVKTAIHLGHARGIVLMALAEVDIPYFEYSTTQIKKSVVGFGNASKEQVQTMTRHLLKLPGIAMTDASDALAAAICHIHSSNFEKRLPCDTKRRRIRNK